ncbi:helix-turn-helix domain-containing protein [Streptosporangium sp. CA-135522]|uniref:helix-turn-helix domain-containing protein n=1 Tax=Streptosporangium sp. CA-135522 TaxID=3240072 RepID=UPI003D8FFDE8
MQQHMTLPEVMKGLRVSRGTALRMIGRGDLVGTKTHDSQQGRWRITVESYEAFVRPEKQVG